MAGRPDKTVGGSLMLCESPQHAKEVARDLRRRGYKAIIEDDEELGPGRLVWTDWVAS